MKTTQVKFIKIFNVIIGGLIALLGFATSCNLVNPDPVMEYGTPSAKFIVNGTIESGISKAPVANVRVVMKGDTILSDKDGKYQVSDNFGFPKDQIYDIQFQDIDGTLNGEYDNLDTIVEFKDPKFTNGNGHWYSGETTKELNITLNPGK